MDAARGGSMAIPSWLRVCMIELIASLDIPRTSLTSLTCNVYSPLLKQSNDKSQYHAVADNGAFAFQYDCH